MSRIDGPKPKPISVEQKTVEAPKEAAPVETVADVATPPTGPTAPAKGFDDLKKKLLSVSGRFTPSKTPIAERADLKDLISSMRLASSTASPHWPATAMLSVACRRCPRPATGAW